MYDEITTHIRNLGFLYLSFAHLNDAKLLDEEWEIIKEKMALRTSKMTDYEKDALMKDIIHWYNRDPEKRHEIINSIIGSIHFEKDNDQKKTILQDLIDIAKVDSDECDEREKEFIKNISNAWGVDFSC